MKIALLISTYNWVEALDLVLKSILNQTRLPDEILIADDGSKENTKELIDNFKKVFLEKSVSKNFISSFPLLSFSFWI